jgi:two-component system response regulator YesN
VSEDIRIFVVDDEQPVLEGVRAVIDGQGEGFTVVGTALNGRHALESIRSLQPDIILMDINMPGLSGVEVMRELRSQGIRAVSILITAYERFDIAREAFGLGIFAYLLKPVTPAQLMSVLDDARREVDLNRQREREHLEVLSRTERYQSRMRECLIALMVGGSLGPEELRSACGEISLDPDAPVRLLMFEWRSAGDGPGQRAAFDHFLTQFGYAYLNLSGMIQHRRIYLLLPSNPEQDALSDALTQIIRRDPRRYAGLQISWASRALESADQIPLAARELACGPLSPLGESTEPIADIPGTVQPSADLADRLERLLLSGDTNRAFEVLTGMARDGGMVPQLLYELALRMFSLLYAREEEQAVNRWLRQSAVADAGNPSEVDGWIRDQLRQLAELYRIKLETNPLIREALLYVEEHFHESFGLEDAAEHCGVSPQHLSKSFSQHMGLSFVDYLTRMRIQHAVELFRKGNSSISEVAASSGYADANYFSRIFKKHQGVSPSSFVESVREDMRR